MTRTKLDQAGNVLAVAIKCTEAHPTEKLTMLGNTSTEHSREEERGNMERGGGQMVEGLVSHVV